MCQPLCPDLSGVIVFDPNNVGIVSDFEDQGKCNFIYWIKLGEHLKADKLVCKGIQLVKPSNAKKYYWVAA